MKDKDEDDEDEGGPLGEFLHLAIGELCEHSGVLQGPDSHKTFSNSPLLLEQGTFLLCQNYNWDLYLAEGTWS